MDMVWNTFTRSNMTLLREGTCEAKEKNYKMDLELESTFHSRVILTTLSGFSSSIEVMFLAPSPFPDLFYRKSLWEIRSIY